jgi:hypothetical protein
MVPPDARTETDGDEVGLARDETRTGVPEDMWPGERYEDVAVIKRLTGRVHARGIETGEPSRGSSPTKEQLHDQAKRLNIRGRSRMTKAELEVAVRRTRP